MKRQILLIPKNRSLQQYVDITLKEFENAEKIEARGEDIPFLVKEYASFSNLPKKVSDNILSILPDFYFPLCFF